MSGSQTQQMDEILNVRSTVGLLIKSFFKRMTAKQMKQLKSGTPDNTTLVMVLDMLWGIIKTLIEGLLTAVRNMNLEVMEERVKSSLSDTVTDSFKAALGVTDVTDLDQLADMIVKEVMVKVQSAVLPIYDTPTELITPNIHMMLPLTSKMIKVFERELKILLTPQSRRKSLTQDRNNVDLQIRLEESDIDESDPESEPEQTKKHSWESTSGSESDYPESYSPMVIEEWPVAEEKSPSATHAAAETQETEETKETRKTAVRIFVEMLVARTLRKSKTNLNATETIDINTRLFKRTWAAVEGVDFDISQQPIKNLDKIIFKDLCEKEGCAEIVLLAMISGEPALYNCIASAVKDHLVTPPKKRSRICRFFSSMGQAITSICKRSDTVHVM